MPAIQLSQLASQIELLLQNWEQPDLLLSQLTDLLEHYADHLYQPAEQTPIQPAIRMYRVPTIILRQLNQALTQKAGKVPQSALQVADRLWKHGYAETIELSAAILGSLPSEFHPQTIQHMETWALEDLPGSFLVKMMDLASNHVRNYSLPEWQICLESWLQSDQKTSQKAGLFGLISLTRDMKYQNLPYIFKNLSPLVQNPPGHLVPELINLLENLAQRSPMETAFFIRQSIRSSSSPAVLRLLRRVLPALPESSQVSLGPLLRDPDPKNR